MGAAFGDTSPYSPEYPPTFTLATTGLPVCPHFRVAPSPNMYLFALICLRASSEVAPCRVDALLASRRCEVALGGLVEPVLTALEEHDGENHQTHRGRRIHVSPTQVQYPLPCSPAPQGLGEAQPLIHHM